MEQFRTLENILNRNRIYTDETMKIEEKNILQKEPLGTLMDLADIERWQKVFKEIETRRIEYNIERIIHIIYEKKYIIQQKQIILHLMKEKFEALSEIETLKRPTCAQWIYSIITRIPTEYITQIKRKSELQLDLDFLDHLMLMIGQQLPIYIKVCESMNVS